MTENLRPYFVIKPGGLSQPIWRDLWEYRELVLTLTWRDLSIRFRQTVIGIGWVVLKPLITMAVLSIIFGYVANLTNKSAVPYPLIILAGLLPWSFFSTTLGEVTVSLVNNGNLISKIYFPRIILPVALMGTFLVDVFINLALLLLLMIYYQFMPSWKIVFLPAFIVLAVAACLGPGLFLAAQCVKYRDFRNVVPFGLQIAMFLSPVGYLSDNIPEKWRLLYSLNPLVGIIDGFRWCLFDGVGLYWPSVLASLCIVALMLYVGLRQFKKAESGFSDLI